MVVEAKHMAAIGRLFASIGGDPRQPRRRRATTTSSMAASWRQSRRVARAVGVGRALADECSVERQLEMRRAAHAQAQADDARLHRRAARRGEACACAERGSALVLTAYPPSRSIPELGAGHAVRVRWKVRGLFMSGAPAERASTGGEGAVPRGRPASWAAARCGSDRPCCRRLFVSPPGAPSATRHGRGEVLATALSVYFSCTVI